MEETEIKQQIGNNGQLSTLRAWGAQGKALENVGS